MDRRRSARYASDSFLASPKIDLAREVESNGTPIHTFDESQFGQVAFAEKWSNLWHEWKPALNGMVLCVLCVYYFCRYQMHFGRIISLEIQNQFEFATKIYDPVDNVEFLQWKETLPKMSPANAIDRIKNGYIECDIFREGKKNVTLEMLHLYMKASCLRTNCRCIHSRQFGVKCNVLFMNPYDEHSFLFMIDPEVVYQDLKSIDDYQINLFSDECEKRHEVHMRIASNITVEYIGIDSIKYKQNMQDEMSVCLMSSIF